MCLVPWVSCILLGFHEFEKLVTITRIALVSQQGLFSAESTIASVTQKPSGVLDHVILQIILS